MKNDEKNKKEEKSKNYEFEIMSKTNSVASTTECTGLIQTPPVNEEEAEAYSDIYVVPNQVNNFEEIKKPHGRHIKSSPSTPNE